MSTEIVPTGNIAALDALTPEAQEIALTGMLDNARAWLAHAVEFTAPAHDINHFRQFIATAAETAKRLKVSKDIQQDAEIMVRRSERALGQAIRRGQEAGEIRTRGETFTSYDRWNGVPVINKVSTKVSPTEYATEHELHGNNAGIYDLTDHVTDEEFDVAIELAQEEQNVSRANVVRKVRDVTGPAPSDMKWERIASLAASGYTRRQIAEVVGLHEETLRRGSAIRNIVFPADAVVGKTKRLDSNRILSGVVDSVSAAAFSLQQVNPLDLDQEALELVDSLTESITALRKAVRTIKESLQ